MFTAVLFSRLAKYCYYFMVFFCLGVGLWTHKFFGPVTIDQILSTVYFDVEGVFASSSIFIKRFIVWCVLGPLFFSALLLGIEQFWYKKIKWLAHIILLIGVINTAYQSSVIDFFRSQTSNNDFFKDNYLNPKTLTFKAHHPKNLVLIYVESLENTYSDKHIFSHDLLQKLHQLNMQHTTFKNYLQMPGANWTIAAIVSTQCGVPLKQSTIFNGNRMGENINRFLPGAKCLTDILAEHGYKNVFMNGSSLRIGGKGRFFQDHHFHELYGKPEWLAKGYKESDMNEWGLDDYHLFQEAKIKLNELMQNKQLFNLTVLTVDMHGVEGSLSPYCRKQGYAQFEGIVECDAKVVADFVNYVKNKGWLNKIDLVILGDHLAMQNLVSDKISKNPTRTIFNMFITPHLLAKNTETIVHFDLLPTLLSTLGFTYNSQRLGLGYAAVGKNEPRHENSLAEIEQALKAKSPTYNALWMASN